MDPGADALNGVVAFVDVRGARFHRSPSATTFCPLHFRPFTAPQLEYEMRDKRDNRGVGPYK